MISIFEIHSQDIPNICDQCVDDRGFGKHSCFVKNEDH